MNIQNAAKLLPKKIERNGRISVFLKCCPELKIKVVNVSLYGKRQACVLCQVFPWTGWFYTLIFLSLLDSTVSPQGHINNKKNRQPFSWYSLTIFRSYLSFMVCRNHNHPMNLMRWIFEISKCSAAQLLKLLKWPWNLPRYCTCDGSGTLNQCWTVTKWKGRKRSIPGGPGRLPSGLQAERREGSWGTCMRTREGHQHLGQCSRVKVLGAGRKQEGRAISFFCSKNWDFAVATHWPHLFFCSNS